MVTKAKPPITHNQCVSVAAPMTELMGRIGGKWAIYVIIALTEKSMRFSELKRGIEGISQKMLTQTLRELEQDGLVTRTVTPSIPPRVDYELTQLGRELQEPLAAVGAWTHRNRDAVVAARQRYAEREQSGW